MLYLDTVEAMEKFFDSGYVKSHMRLFGMYAKIYERKGVVLLSSLFSAFGDLIKP